MKTFILIHGSWHSAWNWHKVVPILEKQGHRVFAMDLPGMGRDKTPIEEVTLASAVQAICKLIASFVLIELFFINSFFLMENLIFISLKKQNKAY